MRNPMRRHHTWLEQGGVPTGLLQGRGGESTSRPTDVSCSNLGVCTSPAEIGCTSASVSDDVLTSTSTENHGADQAGVATSVAPISPLPVPSSPTLRGSSPPASPLLEPVGTLASRVSGMLTRRSSNEEYRRSENRNSELDAASPGGVTRRRTTKSIDANQRMTDRDATMRAMVRRVESEEKDGASRFALEPEVVTLQAAVLSPRSFAELPNSSRSEASQPQTAPNSLREIKALSQRSEAEDVPHARFSVSCDGGDHSERSATHKRSRTERPRMDRGTPSRSNSFGRHASKEGGHTPWRMRPLSRTNSHEDIAGMADSTPQVAEQHDHYHRETKLVDASFLQGNDYRVPLTSAQVEHFSLIFELNDHAGLGHLKVCGLFTLASPRLTSPKLIWLDLT